MDGKYNAVRNSIDANHFTKSRAVSSVGERFVHTEEVTGSNPVPPTSLSRFGRSYARVGQLDPCCIIPSLTRRELFPKASDTRTLAVSV